MNEEDFNNYIKNITDIHLINELSDYALERKNFTVQDAKDYIKKNDVSHIIEKQRKSILLKLKYHEYDFIDYDDGGALNIIHNENHISIEKICTITNGPVIFIFKNGFKIFRHDNDTPDPYINELLNIYRYMTENINI